MDDELAAATQVEAVGAGEEVVLRVMCSGERNEIGRVRPRGGVHPLDPEAGSGGLDRKPADVASGPEVLRHDVGELVGHTPEATEDRTGATVGLVLLGPETEPRHRVEASGRVPGHADAGDVVPLGRDLYPFVEPEPAIGPQADPLLVLSEHAVGPDEVMQNGD